MPNGPGNALELHADWLRVWLADGSSADFHYRWLRHNCDRERHPYTRERTRCSSELADDVRPRAAEVRGEALHVVWHPDGHESSYPLTWLAEHAYARDRVDVPPPSSDLATLEIAAAEGPLERVVALALERVRTRGAAVVRHDPKDSTPAEAQTELIIAAFAAAGLETTATHFGRIEDLRTDNTTNQNTDQLGYTDAPVHLHTDQPFLDHPPRYQLLQCIRPADEGGDNLLADARAAFRHLEAHDARAAELLATVPVRFDRRQQNFARVVESPIVARRGDDDFLIRCSYFTLAPYRLPFARMSEFYRAHDRFIRLVRDPRHHVRVRLEAGDWLIYDNHRTLHARTGFSGPRWLRGVYFDPPAVCV